MKKIYFLLLALCSSLVLLAQDAKDVNIDVNTDGGDTWYTSPWVWVIGAAVFILLLVALTRGGRRRD